jgi:hypothetical protein
MLVDDKDLLTNLDMKIFEPKVVTFDINLVQTMISSEHLVKIVD